MRQRGYCRWYSIEKLKVVCVKEKEKKYGLCDVRPSWVL